MSLQELQSELEKRMRQLKNADPEQIGFLKKKIAQLEEQIQGLEPPKPKPEELKEFVLTVSGKKIKFNKAGVCNLEYGSLLKRVDQSNYIIMYGAKTDKDAELVYTDGKWQISCCDAPTFPTFQHEDLGLAITYLLDFMHDKYSGAPALESATDNWVASELINNESSTDQELINYFIEEGNMAIDEAEFYVSQRNEALQNTLNFILKPYVPKSQKKAEIPIDIIEEVQKKPRKKKMSAEMEDVDELKRYLTVLDEILATSKSTSVKNQIESEKIEVQELINEIESQ
jgi:hypothetical protein